MFATGSIINNRKVEHIADGITKVHKLYLQRGFKITHINTDCEFEPLRKEMTALCINPNCASKMEHVPEIERLIRTVKDPVRSAGATMTFKHISKLMIVHLVASVIFWLNAFPPSTPGVELSYTKGPGQLILGNTVDYKKFCRLQTGEYVQVHQEDETRNTIAIDRTVGEISLGPHYNLQGGYFSEILLTYKRIWRSN